MQTKIDKKTRLVADIVLIVLLLAVGLSAILITKLTTEDGYEATVTVNGETVGSYPLSENGRFEINGGTNILVIENGEAYVEWASCPDGVCKHRGRISGVGEKIVCIPNRVMIEIY